MKFQNPSFNFFLNGRTNGQTNGQASRKQYDPHFFKVGGININESIGNYRKIAEKIRDIPKKYLYISC